MSEASADGANIATGILRRINADPLTSKGLGGMLWNESMKTVDGIFETHQDPDQLKIALATELASLKARVYEAKAQAQTFEMLGRYDRMTKLHNRQTYHTDLTNEVKKALASKKPDETDILHVVRIDIGMLNMYNFAGGHASGDRYKQFMAGIFQSLDVDKRRFIAEKFNYFNAYSLEGDEFALVVRGKTEDVKAMMQLMEHAVQHPIGEDVEHTTTFRINKEKCMEVPRHLLFDYGIAAFDSEGVTGFRKINEFAYPQGHLAELEARVSQKQFPDQTVMVRAKNDKDREGDVVRAKNYLDEFADYRATARKAMRRIPYLVELKKNDPEAYAFIINFARKGAMNIPDEFVDMLGKSQVPGEQIKHYVVQQLDAVLSGNLDALTPMGDPYRQVFLTKLKANIDQMCQL